mgnify:CR=1
MKKFLVVAVVLAVGVSFAFASSLKVPWFVDNAPEDTTNPPASGLVIGNVFLTNNLATDVECAITYFDKTGADIGFKPATGGGATNTFVIPAGASWAFRPVADGGSQEGGAGAVIPNRPDGGKNGSIRIEYVGANGAIGGYYAYTKTSSTGAVVSYAHLLPAGVEE